MRSFWIPQVNPKCKDKCPYKRQKRKRERTEAEIEVIWPQAKEEEDC